MNHIESTVIIWYRIINSWEKEVDTIVIEVKEVYNTTYILTKHYSNFTPLLR